MENSMKKKKRIVLLLVSMMLIIPASRSIYVFVKKNATARKEDMKVQKIVSPEKYEKNESSNTLSRNETNSFELTRDAYDQLKSEYPRTVGYIAWDSEFISEPIGQSYDNEYFLWRSLNGYYNELGTVYMDATCTSDSQNITLYGHYVYYDGSSRFSPLSKLTSQAVYDQNHRFKIWFDDHVSTYEIAYVTHLNIDTETDFDYSVSRYYDDEIFEKHKDWLDKHQLINPVSEARLESSTDRTVTLQTCVPWHSDLIELVIAKEVNSEKF